ncbi:TRAP transporter substrate-binding protein [Oscillibacter sp.]|uniref:TRAP transporter substrate-binding protein n=1 Tax=Oscillibacter sp. TaxID=1945593 RepID=UPI00260FB161|nr:TRAP transporter substrate-binding protein [Oscillibacter sp.]MDD3346194.1 TRAP transporter substrate-binding protein [Oscillibacter sp.]
MKKFLSLLLVLGLSATLLAGCGGSKKEEAPSEKPSTETSQADGYDTVNIIAAHGATETTSMHQSWLKFEELVEERSGGAVTVDLYPNQQLGGDREFTEASTQGNVTMGSPSPAAVAALMPSLNAFETPFLFSDYETAYKAMDSDAGKALLDSMSSAGLQGLGYYENGFRNLTCNKEVNTLADLKGMKIRTMENEVHLAIWTALGANPSPLAFGELYTALQQKAFDAQENPLEQIYNNKLHEVQSHVYLTQHVYTPYIIFINKAVWDGLNAKTQELIQSCVDESVAYNRELCAVNNQKCIEGINNSGKSKVYEVNEALHGEMVQACTDAGIYDLVIEKAGGTYAQDFWAAAGFNYQK